MGRPSKSHGAKKGEWVLDLRGEAYPVWADPARAMEPRKVGARSEGGGIPCVGRPSKSHGVKKGGCWI